MTSINNAIEIRAEQLAYWYFRLNGFLTTVNFVVHHETDSDQRTDIDILGVRFPYRAELHPTPMEDDLLVSWVNGKPYIIIAEVKKGKCKLNGPWTKPNQMNMHRVLRSLGSFPQENTEETAQALYQHGWINSSYFVTLFCLGSTENENLRRRYPKVPPVTWIRVLSFIYNRFKDYSVQKVNHDQWDDNGKNLWRCIMSSQTEPIFIRNVNVVD